MLQRTHAALIHLLVYALAAGSLWAQGISSSGVVAPCSPPADLDNSHSLYFPFFQTDHGSFSGYAASNFSDSMALLDFGALGGDGQFLPFARNPSRFELAPQNQLAQQGIEIFQAEDEAHSGWVRMVADNSSIGSFFQFGSSNLSWLDGGVAVSEPSRKFYFTRVLNGPEALWGHSAETFLSLANSTPEPIELQLTYRPNRAPGAAPSGLQGAAVVKNLELPACGFVYRSVAEIYGENLSGGYLEVEVIQGSAAVGFALIDFKEQSTVIGLNASPGNPFKEAFSAQLAIVPSEVSTSFKVINVSSGERTVQFSALGSDGEALVEPFQIVFQPGQALEQDAATLLGIAGPVEGSVHLTASGDGIIGDVVFGNPEDLSYAAALLLQDRRFLEAVFSQVANLEGFFTGLALYFPGPGTAQVTIEVISAAGVKTGETTLQLEAGVRLSELLVDLIASTAGQVGGLILIRSDKGLVAQELFGTSGLTLLSAVPPTLSRVAPELIESPYARWENGPSTDSDYFPIGVWVQDPARAQQYKDIGINLYVGLWLGPTDLQLTQLEAADMPVFTFQNQRGLISPQNHVIQAWTQFDEPDNAQPDGQGGFGPCIPPTELVARYNQLQSRDSTRPVFLNFGQGVAYINWVGRGSCTGDTSYYPKASKAADIVSFDIYPVTSSRVVVHGNLEFVAEGVANLVEWSGGEKIVWNFIETTHINHPTDRPTASQIKTEVWMSIIHGSMGIMYFVHEWEPEFREAGIFEYPEIVEGVRDINSEVTSLAAVLNSPAVDGGAQVEAAVPVAHLVKEYGGSTYVFAVAMRNQSTQATFTVSAIEEGQVEVLGEDRFLQLSEGQFQDDFSGYAVHLYKIGP